jgi:hypothetical protein
MSVHDRLTARVLRRHLRAAGPHARLEDIAARVREIIHRVREQPTFGPPELVAALVGVVDVAEDDGDEADEGEG